ncbi:PREDICTED: E3 ubiquitin-protein ligase AIP2-like [Fragaria vesca subsp. vesca]|uniref:E3 ubiquitin-protein ligase AIP2-like n=1 Tax=Fragaria vesca subsp. vesca TaxID=101020 RepID=UPI0002C3317A|nr:PREDICTED: E3 ubiquitin-protein ligase AIP2-like [Fragaria vesca subsp. vesca]
MDVPELVQPPIIEEIFKVVDVAVPKLPIMVDILDITYVDSGGLFPATKPAMHSRFGEVRLDSLDEAIVTRTPSCLICLKDLDHRHIITRLPWSHVYHADCIVSWLETTHFCPVCQYSMPFVRRPRCKPFNINIGGLKLRPRCKPFKIRLAQAQDDDGLLRCS